MSKGRVLIIAGSDSGGGAGIQADIKTVTMLGGYAATAITCITVQNTLGVSHVHPVPADVVYGQIKAVLDDIGADVIKTGMLFSADIINAVCDALRDCEYRGQIVVDPVMVATSGDNLLQQEAVDVLKQRLLPMATVITPNAPELAVLSGLPVVDTDTMLVAAKLIIARDLVGVIAKGGHINESHSVITDLFVQGDAVMKIDNPRLDSRNTHGTGCTLASGIAAGMAKGQSSVEAWFHASNFVHSAIQNAPDLGQGAGPMGHGQASIEIEDDA